MPFLDEIDFRESVTKSLVKRNTRMKNKGVKSRKTIRFGRDWCFTYYTSNELFILVLQ